MGRADGEHLGETEFEEISGERLMHLLIDLVDDKKEGLSPAPEHVGQFPVERR